MSHVKHPPNGHLSQWILDQLPKGYRGHALDIGASDGISISTTWALEKSHGWTCLCVEPNPEFHPSLLKERMFVERCACDSKPGTSVLHVNEVNPEAYSALRVSKHPGIKGVRVQNWKKVEVRVETVEGLLKKWQFDKLDALCIDTEGTEGDVLKGIDLALWRPKVVIVEAWEQGTHDAYLSQFGYRRAGRSVDNDMHVLVED